MVTATQSLIETEEVEELIAAQDGVTTRLRVPLMIILGIIIIAIFTILILIIISFVSSNTGLDTIFPFLDKKPI